YPWRCRGFRCRASIDTDMVSAGSGRADVIRAHALHADAIDAFTINAVAVAGTHTPNPAIVTLAVDRRLVRAANHLQLSGLRVGANSHIAGNDAVAADVEARIRLLRGRVLNVVAGTAASAQSRIVGLHILIGRYAAELCRIDGLDRIRRR